LKTPTRVLSLLLGLSGLLCAPAVFPQAVQQPSIEQSASSYNDAELRSFAVAALEVQRINDIYVPKLETAKSPEEQQQIQQTASQEMVRAVENEGISVDRYKEILSDARANPALAARVQEHMKSTGK
jgi:hypothetical protein